MVAFGTDIDVDLENHRSAMNVPLYHAPIPMETRVLLPSYVGDGALKGTVIGISTQVLNFIYIVLLDESISNREGQMVRGCTIPGTELRDLEGQPFVPSYQASSLTHMILLLIQAGSHTEKSLVKDVQRQLGGGVKTEAEKALQTLISSEKVKINAEGFLNV